MAKTPSHSLETISKLLDLTPRRVQQLSKEGVIPKSERGRYELVPAVRGYINYLRERSINAGVISFDDVRVRKTTAEAEMAEIELKEKKEQLIPIEHITNTWMELIGASKQRMLAIPAKLAPIVAVEEQPAICKQIIEDQIIECLEELTQYIAGDNADSDNSLERDSEEGMETTH